MLELRPVSYLDIQHWFVDFQKKSKVYELLSDDTEFMGIFKDKVLVGYFAFKCYSDRVIQIIQGYLSKEVRHNRLSQLALVLLEQKAKRIGFNRVVLTSQRSFKAYVPWMHKMGYKPTDISFCKEI